MVLLLWDLWMRTIALYCLLDFLFCGVLGLQATKVLDANTMGCESWLNMCRKNQSEHDLTKVYQSGDPKQTVLGFLLKMSSITGCTIYFVLLVSELQKLFRITVPSKLLVMRFLLEKPYMCNQRYFANENLTIANPLLSGNIMSCWVSFAFISDCQTNCWFSDKQRIKPSGVPREHGWLGNPL